jgi:hypothetical protein
MLEIHDLPPVEEEGDIIYKALQADELEQTISCLAKIFSEAEPMSKALKFTYDEMRGFSELLCSKALNKRLSLIAKDSKTGEVISFSLADDFVEWPPQDAERTNEKISSLLALVNDLDDEYKKTRKVINTGEIFHLSFLGSCCHYQQRKIATSLIEKHLQLARMKGFSTAVAEVTGLASQHILIDKFGFTEKVKIDYKSYVYHGVHIYEGIEDASSCILVEKRL